MTDNEDNRTNGSISKKILRAFASLTIRLLIAFILWTLVNIENLEKVKLMAFPKCFLKTAFRGSSFFVVRNSDCRGLLAKGCDFLGIQW